VEEGDDRRRRRLRDMLPRLLMIGGAVAAVAAGCEMFDFRARVSSDPVEHHETVEPRDPVPPEDRDRARP
jgi:hypothetical protein